MGLLPKGQLTVANGEIRLQGDNIINKTPAELRALRGTRMAMVFQEPMTALNPVIPVGEQIGEVLEIHTGLSASERREKVLDIMNAVHLPDADTMIDSYPHQLSGGQRQRIMIAAALVLDPVLLIADEPTTALDVTTQAQILKLIKEMQVRRNTGVLFITHDFGVVADIADRVVVMQKGRVVEQGPAKDVLKNPQHPYTRMLIAAVPSLNPPSRTDAAPAAIALETRHLKKTYGSAAGFLSFGKNRIVHAVHDASITVARGETLGIVGESGSGKSTVARCIVRLVDPTAGDVLIDAVPVGGLSTAQWRPWRRKIQVVFQDPYRSLNPRRTVADAIVEGPMNFGLSHGEALARARSLMQLVGLSADALERYPHQFSGGQRQRICIARALAMEPEILIADEAVSALDVSVQAQVLELLENVQKEFNLAMLFITHDLRVAAQICDRIVVMWKGQIVEQGETAGVYRAPQHDYTRRLLQAAPGRDFAFGSGIAAS